ncbi:hypothetical protein BpHYR1_052842 [Brachionus plicatilis]|uniref:Uncharacterized protein n=1 Tax=Brachionus plicatilis TaxID=10195 RepID=A0A3M7RIM1_BRAPC|nr:hypothetical protein BpHYR1_052842 [Brachionus plicatilis]
MEKLTELQKELELKFQDLRCFLNKNDTHFLNEAKILPCSNRACLECIQKMTKESCLFCGYCNSEHMIQNIEELISQDQIFDTKINDSRVQVMEERINEFISGLIDQLDNKDIEIENECTVAKKEINERVNENKDSFERLNLKMVNKLELIKENLKIELNKSSSKIENKIFEFEIFCGIIQESIERIEQNQFIDEIYKLQKIIDEMESLDESFNKILNCLFFEPSQCIPNEQFVCPSLNKLK